MAIHGKRITIRPVDMQLVLEIVEKAPQLAGLKNAENPIPKSRMGGKRLPASVKKARDAFLVETGLTQEEIHEIAE